MDDTLGTFELVRSRLTDLVVRRRPRLTIICAPAGYGKSTFVRQLLARFDDATICNCLGVQDEADLARAVLAALAGAAPALGDAIAHAQLSATSDPRDWESAVMRFWNLEGAAMFVFENAETLARLPGAAALFEKLVRRARRRIVVCSREPVDIPYGHGIDPTNVVRFGIDDLRFTPDETRRALPGCTESEQAAIESASRGWPIVVALLGQAVREEPLANLVARLDRIVHDELLTYLSATLIAELSPDEAELARVLAVVPDPTDADIARGWPAIGPHGMKRLAARVPLTRGRDGVLRLHPMLLQLFRERAADRIPSILARAAAAALAAGDETRAAELHLAAGDQLAAAGALRNLGSFVMTSPTARLAAVISRFDEQTLVRFPALWCSALNHRGYAIPPHEWLRSAEAMWRNLPATAGDDVRSSVFNSLMVAHTNLGRCTRAAELLDGYRDAFPGAGSSPLVMIWSVALEIYDGRYDRLAGATTALTPLLDMSPLTHALYLCEAISAVAVSRGEWQRANEILHRTRELFDRTPMSVALFGLVESAFGAWLSGDDARCDAFVADLDDRVTNANERGHRFFIDCVRGRAESAQFGYERLTERVKALLIAAARAATRTDGRRLAAEAVGAADQSERRTLRVLARGALALLDDDRRDELLNDALRLAATLDSAAMRTALGALLERKPDAGMLAPFAARYESQRSGANAIDIRLLRGEVVLGEATVALARSEMTVLAALAQEPRAFSICELGDLLFPELDADSAGNRLYVYIHRLRQRLGRDAVVGERTGYRLGQAVDVDLWRIERLAAKVRAGQQFAQSEAAALKLEPLSAAELDAFGLRLRLPEAVMRRIRGRRVQQEALRGAARAVAADG